MNGDEQFPAALKQQAMAKSGRLDFGPVADFLLGPEWAAQRRAAEATPAWSKERLLFGGKTLLPFALMGGRARLPGRGPAIRPSTGRWVDAKAAEVRDFDAFEKGLGKEHHDLESQVENAFKAKGIEDMDAQGLRQRAFYSQMDSPEAYLRYLQGLSRSVPGLPTTGDQLQAGPKVWESNIYNRKYSSPLGMQEWANLYATPDVEFTAGPKVPRGTSAGPLPEAEQNALLPGTEGWYDPRTGKLLPGNKELLQKWNELTNPSVAPPPKEPPKFYPPGDTDRSPSGYPPWWLTLQRFQTPSYA